ncbi:MAG: hypothetical protein AAFY83_11650 [Pseudomonadota bacterium]
MRRYKSFTSLSTATVGCALLLVACGAEGEGEGEGQEGTGAAPTISGEGATGEGEGGAGEGEGEGEGEGTSSANLASNDGAYLQALGQVRGHLFAFITLYREGKFEMAATHAKHPGSELYKALAPAITARKQPGFADGLTALTEALANNGDVETVYTQLLADIKQHQPALSLGKTIVALSGLTRTAADEFKLGVDGTGAIINAHEYQDAYGFLNTAKAILNDQTANGTAEKTAKTDALAQIDIALGQFGDLTAATSAGDGSKIYGAAARMEITGLGLK